MKRSLFTTLAEDQLSEDNFTAHATGAAETDRHHLIYTTTTGALLYDADVNGSGAAIRFATLDKKPELKAADIFAMPEPAIRQSHKTRPPTAQTPAVSAVERVDGGVCG